jgi:leukotriene-A4 hydrolase
MYKILLIFAAILFISGCGDQDKTAFYKSLENDYDQDPHTFAKPSEARIEHIDFDLTINFQDKKIEGLASYKIVHNKANEIVLDIRNIKIIKIWIGKTESEVDYFFGETDSILGQALHIPIAPLTDRIKIQYETTAGSDALQWLDPVQTLDKKHPFLYTQSQPIFSRTWLPVQDSPGLRFTWSAKVQCPSEMMVVMSTRNQEEKNEEGVYYFEMEHPVPAYLIALAAGDLRFSPMSSRSGVYAEPGIIENALSEFSRTEEMMQFSEKLMGPYQWDRYDILVLPPSFPYGGMENPMLTFVTPTIIAGDQSLTALIAHELAHSWTGNSVTSFSWNDLWLNEGFTVYFERRIMEELYGPDYTAMLDVLTYQSLVQLIRKMGEDNPDTRLKLNLKGRDPEKAMNRIAYDKGYFLLKLLEQSAGRKYFDAFIQGYLNSNKFSSIDTESFLEYLDRELISKYKIDIDVKEWIYLPGLPKNCPVPFSSRLKQVDESMVKLLKNNDIEKLDTKHWTAHEWRYFISNLPRSANLELISGLNKSFNLSVSKNPEIKAAWLELCIYAGYYIEIETVLEDFIQEVGRRKFLMPLYTALIQTDRIADANRMYKNSRNNYHAATRVSLDELLNFDN